MSASNLVLPRPSLASGGETTTPIERSVRKRKPSQKVLEQRTQEAEVIQNHQQKQAAEYVPRAATDLFVTSRVVPTRMDTLTKSPLKQRGPKERVPPARKSSDEDDEASVIGLSDSEPEVEILTPISQTSRKRRGSSIDAMRETQVRRTSSDGRPRARDYRDLEKKALEVAMEEFRSVIFTREAFPDHAQECEVARMVWKNACKEVSLTDSPLTGRLLKLITARGAHARGELKSKGRVLVEAHYHFKTSSNRAVINKNRTRSKLLTNGPNEGSEAANDEVTAGLTYKVFSDDPATWSGLYENGVVQKLINMTSFKNKNDTGIKFEQYFNPFPVEGLALMYTVVECCVDEWVTGVRADISFTAAAYRDVYKKHLTNLQRFQECAKDEKVNVLLDIRNKITRRAKVHAGVQLITARTVPDTPIKAFDTAFNAYKAKKAKGEVDSDDEEVDGGINNDGEGSDVEQN